MWALCEGGLDKSGLARNTPLDRTLPWWDAHLVHVHVGATSAEDEEDEQKGDEAATPEPAGTGFTPGRFGSFVMLRFHHVVG